MKNTSWHCIFPQFLTSWEIRFWKKKTCFFFGFVKQYDVLKRRKIFNRCHLGVLAKEFTQQVNHLAGKTTPREDNSMEISWGREFWVGLEGKLDLGGNLLYYLNFCKIVLWAGKMTLSDVSGARMWIFLRI